MKAYRNKLFLTAKRDTGGRNEKMSNTVKIKNKKKKKEIKVNYKLWAIIFGVFVAVIVGLSVWASFHWGVGMGTIGVRPVDPEDAAEGMTELASEYATDGNMVLTPEQLEQLGISLDGEEGAAEEAAAEGEAAEDGSAAEEAAAEDAAAEDAAAEDAAENEAAEEGGAADKQ